MAVCFKFPKSSRLIKRHQFQSLSKLGSQTVGRYVIIEKLQTMTDNQQPKLGITVSKRFGKAILRNRFKRVIRESFRHAACHLPSGLSLNIRPRSQATLASSKEIREEFYFLLKLSPELFASSIAN